MGGGPESPELRVHRGDDPRIGRILELIDEAARPRPLPEVLGALCAEVALVVAAPVASVYVRERSDGEGDTAAGTEELVLRANVGFPGRAIHRVRLAIGEGITGFAAECMLPVTVSGAPGDVHYKPVPGLPEEEYPTFLALPVLVGRRAEAVVVLQRRVDHPFSEHEVVLATALTTAFAYALERARAGRNTRGGRASRTARLMGQGLAPGRALGRAETAATFEGLAALARARGLTDDGLSGEERSRAVASAVKQTGRVLARARRDLEGSLPPADRGRLEALALVWDDQRFVRELAARAKEEPNPVDILRDMARAYARAPYDVAGPEEVNRSLRERSGEMEALCLQVAARVVDVRLPAQGAALLLPAELPALWALAAASSRATAIAVGGAVDAEGPGVAVARAAGLPVVAGVAGLYAWAREGDRLLVDAVDGLVWVNPSATAIARFRRGGAP
ncbi:MAG: GAF domain-containing protein [Sandaracinaceae bacterium]